MAMREIVECVPNFSEGRRRDVVDAIVSAMRAVSGVRVLDVELDAAHNRSVVTLVGPPQDVVEAAFRGVRRATELIDMEQHRGEHPRIGAADVVPFVPILGVTMDDCVRLAHELGRRIGEELAIPVYLYGEAATRPERRLLPNVRKGEYEGLKETIATEARRPDFGPARLGPAGAVAVGARPPLIAFNVNLRTGDIAIAKTIARTIREASGGLPAVRALGLETAQPGIVQVSMNLVDYRRTPIWVAYEAVRAEAARYGVEVIGSEIVGLVPLEALTQVVEHALGLAGFAVDRVIETHLIE